MTDVALPASALHGDATAQRLVRIGAWAVCIAGCAIAAMMLAEAPVRWSHVVINLCAGLAGGASLLLARGRRWHRAAQVLVWCVWATTSLAAAVNGGIHSPNVLSYPVLIIFAGWLLGIRATLWIAGATGALFLGFVWGDARGWIPTADYGSRAAYLVYYSTVLMLTTMVTLLSRRSYRRRVAEAYRAAYFDPLTGLRNRNALMHRLEDLQDSPGPIHALHALVLLDLDRFATFNHARSNDLGDRLLRAVAQRLQGLLPGDALLVRVAGDEFAVVLHGLGADAARAGREALACADTVLQGLCQPLAIGGEGEVRLTASAGIALHPQRGAPGVPGGGVDETLRRAGTALRRAKEQGGGRAAFFEQGMAQAAEQRFRIERELRQAIQAGELRLYLQSQVDREGRVTGAETLVRWQHPQRGLVPPAAFIPVAEESDLIVALGDWVLARACALLAAPAWRARGLSLSVNVSARQFRDAGFVPRLQALLAQTGAAPARLTLEVTEGLVMDDFDDAVAKMHALGALGVAFALDDFGTGYSSLAYLKRLPIHELKIDKSFVQDVLHDGSDAALVEAILRVADRFGLRVVAEGVETEAQAGFLAERAPRILYQGYLFGRPLPQEEWLAAAAMA